MRLKWGVGESESGTNLNYIGSIRSKRFQMLQGLFEPLEPLEPLELLEPLEPYSVACSPSLKRTKRLMVMFSPVLAVAAATICLIVTFGSRTEGWSIRHTWA